MDGVVTVTPSVAAALSVKSPLKVVPLLKDCFLLTPFHWMLSDWITALTKPSGCVGFKLLGTVNASNTLQTFSN